MRQHSTSDHTGRYNLLRFDHCLLWSCRFFCYNYEEAHIKASHHLEILIIVIWMIEDTNENWTQFTFFLHATSVNMQLQLSQLCRSTFLGCMLPPWSDHIDFGTSIVLNIVTLWTFQIESCLGNWNAILIWYVWWWKKWADFSVTGFVWLWCHLFSPQQVVDIVSIHLLCGNCHSFIAVVIDQLMIFLCCQYSWWWQIDEFRMN